MVTGGSQGGFQSFATAALCPQITEVSAFVPPAAIARAAGQSARALAGPSGLLTGAQGTRPEEIQETAGYYDGINFAARIHCPTLMCVA